MNNEIDPLYSWLLAKYENYPLELSSLEKRIDELIAVCDDLSRKHESKTADQANWIKERTRLLEKNEQAKVKIEAMISRLKSLDQD